LSRTVSPAYCAYFLRADAAGQRRFGLFRAFDWAFARCRAGYAGLLGRALRWRYAVVLGGLAAFAASLLLYPAIGKGPELVGEVERTSYSLDRTARTLLAEIDLPNPEDRLRPGMYAYATLTAEHPDALTLPTSAVGTQGDVTQGYQTYC